MLILTDEERAELDAVNTKRRERAARRDDYPDLSTFDRVDLGDGVPRRVVAVSRANGKVERVGVMAIRDDGGRWVNVPGSERTYSAGSWAAFVRDDRGHWVESDPATANGGPVPSAPTAGPADPTATTGPDA